MRSEFGKAVYNAHFRTNGYRTGENFRGVGRVMMVQNDILRARGFQPVILTGETDSTDRLRDHVVLLPSLAWYPRPVPSSGEVFNTLTQETGSAPILFHNHTNSKDNLGFSQAAANLVDASVRGERDPAVLWVHDIGNKERTLQEVHSIFPTESGARIAAISNIRLEQLQRLFAQFHDQGLVVPEYDMRVIPNPIELQFFQTDIADAPSSLESLAPRFTTFTETHHLPQTVEDANRVLFGEDKYVKFILNGIVARKKGTMEAINAVEAYANEYHPAALIITNTILTHRQNAPYFEELLTKLRSMSDSQRKNFKVIILGGVERKYMRWLYQQCDLQLAPFELEGFSFPPFEAALTGVSTAFAEDPAMLESTDGNGLTLPMTTWRSQPLLVARAINQYMGTAKEAADISALSTKAHNILHPDVIGTQLEEIITP